MSLLLCLNPKQFNVLTAYDLGHWPPLPAPKKKKRKKSRDWKEKLLGYMQEERAASELPDGVVEQLTKELNATAERVRHDWNAMMAMRRKRERDDEELLLMWMLSQ